MEPWAAVKGTPMARSTWEGCSEPLVQAEPDEAQMPSSLSSIRIDSPSTYSKLRLLVLGSRFLTSPLTMVLGMLFRSAASSRSRRALTRVFSSCM